MDFRFRLFDFKDTQVLDEMFEACFGTAPAPGYFDWKYRNNPAGEAVAFVAESEGRLAGFYGVIPEWYMIGGQKQLIFQSMDTMTHPDFRRKGLFTRLANKTYDYLRETKGSLNIIGFPGETSYPGFIKKLDWSTLAEIKYKFVYKPVFVMKSLSLRPTNLLVEVISEFDASFERYFEKRAKRDQGKSIVKYLDREIANWRFFQSPMMEYDVLKLLVENELVGFLTYRIDEKQRLFIVCIDFIDDSVTHTAVTDVLKFLFKKHGVSSIYTFESSSQRISRALELNGFMSNPFSKGPFSYQTPIIVYGDMAIGKIDFYDPKNWDILPYLRDY